MSNNNNAVTIRVAIERDPTLATVVKEAAATTTPYIGFYFSPFDDGGQEGEWSYWASETADASATNCYYTPKELVEMLAGLNK